MKIKLSKTLHQLARRVAVPVQITVALAKIAQDVSIVPNKAAPVVFVKSLLRRKSKSKIFICNKNNGL